MFDAPWHWVIVAVVVIALFGYKRMPDAARSLGRSLRIFKTEIKGMAEDDKARDQAHETSGTATVVTTDAQPAVPVATPVVTPSPTVGTTSAPAATPAAVSTSVVNGGKPFGAAE